MTHRHAHATTEAATADPVIQRACACGKGGGVESKCPDCAAAEKLSVQTRLRVNAPGDAYEREADRVADQVVSGHPGPAPAISSLPMPPLQRQADEDEEELQTKAAPGRAPCAAPEGFAGRLQRAAAGGRPLPSPLRGEFERRMGRDLARVRIHDGSDAQALSRDLHARAFTHRNDIFFGAGQFDPGSKGGRHLLAHELAHTVQQSRSAGLAGTLQRRLQPAPGKTPVCDPPRHLKGGARRTWLRDLGKEVHDEIQKKFLSRGRSRLKELTLPFTDTAVCKDADGYEPSTETGRPDLAIAERKRGKINLRLGEIKPYNVLGVGAGAAVMECYENGIARNADACKVGADSFIDKYSGLIGQFCRRIGASSGQMIQLGRGIGWNPGPVTAKGRAIATINLGGGLIFYGCADLLNGKKKKQKKDKDERKKKKASKKAAKQETRSTKKASRKASRKARKISKEAVSEAAEKKIEKTVAKKAAKKGVLKAAGKKLIPGEAYLEAAAIALALLGGAKPAFGADGMSAEEALLEMAEHGLPPNVTISPELMELLTQNPEVLELFKKAAEGKATSDEAAQAMIDLLEANKDLLDAETLEKLAKFTAESGEPELQQTAEEFRAQLEKIKLGAKPGEGGAEGTSGEAPDLFDDPAPESDAKKDAEKKPAGTDGTDQAFPEDFTNELNDIPVKKYLLKEVVKRAETPDFGEEKIKAFRDAMSGLDSKQIEKILAELSAMPRADLSKGPAAQGSLEIVQELAAALKAGKTLPTKAAASDATTQDTGSPDAANVVVDADAGLTEIEAKWAVAGIKWHKKKGGKKYEIGLKFAYSNDGLASELDKIARRKMELKTTSAEGRPASLGSLMTGIGYRTDSGVRVGTFGTVAVTDIEGQRLTLEIRSYKSFVTLDGKAFAQPVTLPVLKVVFAKINKGIYDFSKAPKP